jgi:hypothetical protein
MSVFLIIGLLAASPVLALSSKEILRSADRARGNLEGITWTVDISSIQNQKESTMTLNVKARGFDIAGESVAPENYKGNKLVMINGSMWFYKPGLSKPVPISRRQKLMGNAVYGDIAATNYADDYIPVALPDETVDNEPCYTFDLKSNNSKSTYDRIVYWISKTRLVGVKADYYTVSGKRFKSAVMQYENTVMVDGKQRPFISRLIISDELISSDITTLIFNDPVLGALADYHFNLNVMRR